LKFIRRRVFPIVLFLEIVVYGCSGGGGSNTATVIPPPPPPPPACSSYTTVTPTSKLKISVKTNGIYLISPNGLKSSCLVLASGLTLHDFTLQNFDPNTKLFVTIPINFDSQDNLEFYGVGVNRNDYTRVNADYTETNVYWLVPKNLSTPQLLMTTKAGSSGGPNLSPLTTLHLEQNNLNEPGMLNGNGQDHWFWDQLLISGGSLVYPTIGSAYSFTLNDYDSQFTDLPILSINLFSKVNTPHAVSVDTPLLVNANVAWNTTTPYTFTSTVTGLLPIGVNGLGLRLTSNADQVYLNWFELEYPGMAYHDQVTFHQSNHSQGDYTFAIKGFTQNQVEVFDITDPTLPLMIPPANISYNSVGSFYQAVLKDTTSFPVKYIALTPAQRMIPAPGSVALSNGVDLNGISGTFDYLIISHENFITNIGPLKVFRESPAGGSHSIYVAKIGDVYDSYSGGIFTPQAIKDFASDFYSKSSLQYLLLVGDASIDYKNYLSSSLFGYSQDNYIPTYLQEYTYGQTPSDFWFVPQTGTPPSSLPNIAIGRIPAKTGAEVDRVVTKILNYQKPSSPSWNQNVLFVAADTFETSSSGLINAISSIPGTFSSTTAYYSLYGATSTYQITNSIGNSGALITNYLGHGSVGVWGNGLGNGSISAVFFQASDSWNLNNSSKLTFLVTLDCLNGDFAGYGEGLYNPIHNLNNPYSLSEEILKSTTGGSIASFSPTGQGYTSNHITLATALYNNLLVPTPPTIGQAIQQAERSVLLSGSVSPQDFETVQIFVLLGDPATQLAVP
jgi:hypothetical protein